MSDKVRIGVIGTGQIGNSHLKKYQAIEDASIVAVCDINEDAARQAAARWDVPQVFTDFRKLLEVEDIVAVDVCLHNNLHAPVSIAAMEAGKHVYCEKPLAGSYVDAKRMLEKSRELDRMLSMQSGRLFSAETQAARRLIEDGWLGDIYYAKSSHYRRRGRPYVDGYGTSTFVKKEVAAGGALFDMGVYSISQLLYLMGQTQITTVSGATHQELPMYEERQAESGYNVEELGIGLVRLDPGITFFIEEAWAIHLSGTDGSKIVGSKGGISLTPFQFHTTISDMEMDGTFDLGGAQTRWGRVYPREADAYRSPQHHWVAALQGRVELAPTAEIGLKTMLISEGIYLSQERGREVSAAEVEEHSQSTALKV